MIARRDCIRRIQVASAIYLPSYFQLVWFILETLSIKNSLENILSKEAYKDFTNVAIKKESEGSGRKHPVYRFFDKDNRYICEVRYGGANANALQRGLWTNTKNALPYFNSVTNGWIDYSHSHILVHLFSHALISSSKGHEIALAEIKQDILRLKQESGVHG